MSSASFLFWVWSHAVYLEIQSCVIYYGIVTSTNDQAPFISKLDAAYKTLRQSYLSSAV